MMESVVYVVDDDEGLRTSLSRLLRAGGLKVETFASAESFLEFVPDERPGCVVLDLRMPGLDGLALQRELAARGRSCQIVFLTGHGSVRDGVDAMKGGAVDFLEKPFEDEVLLEAVDHALARSRKQRRLQEVHHEIVARYETLTPREREVLGLVVTGLLNKQIASRLGTSEKTVKVHRGRVMKKMQARSVAELVRLAELLEGAR